MNVIKVHKSNMENRKLSKTGEQSSTPPPAKSSEVPVSRTGPTAGAPSSTNKVNSEVIDNQTQIRKLSDSHPDMGDARPKYRHMNSQSGRTQLQQFSGSQSKDEENESKIEKFKTLHAESLLNLVALRELSWSGVPKRTRALTWRLLSGYIPTALERRNSTLERKRANYHSLVEQYFHTDSRDEAQQDTFRQIHIDMPRMNPHVQLFQQRIVQEMFERILFIWAIRHPASGYVQGINDLVTPFFIVFLQECLYSIGACKFDYAYSNVAMHTANILFSVTAIDLDTFKLDTLSECQLSVIEADSFWCLSKFLDCIQDNYIFAQLGIQAKVNQLKELIQRIDGM